MYAQSFLKRKERGGKIGRRDRAYARGRLAVFEACLRDQKGGEGGEKRGPRIYDP